jgi:polygalacturonase
MNIKDIIKRTGCAAALLLSLGTPQAAYGQWNNYEARRDSVLQLISGAAIPSKTINITALGAKGDGKKDCKAAFDKAMKRASQNNGLHIVVPAGTYLVNGPIKMVSNVCIELQDGATLKFSDNPTHYLPVVDTSWEGTFVKNYCPFIYAYNAKNVAIIGKGTIDGNADATFATWKMLQAKGKQLSRDMNHNETAVEERVFGEGYYLRPQLIQFFGCTGGCLHHPLTLLVHPSAEEREHSLPRSALRRQAGEQRRHRPGICTQRAH